MKKENESESSGKLPVPTTREEARETYDTVSRYYDYTIVGAFGRKYATMALQRLSIAEGETALEIGPGTKKGARRL